MKNLAIVGLILLTAATLADAQTAAPVFSVKTYGATGDG
jgi:hypothetical protein